MFSSEKQNGFPISPLSVSSRVGDFECLRFAEEAGVTCATPPMCRLDKCHRRISPFVGFRRFPLDDCGSFEKRMGL